jgi:hypothetical protein
MHTVRREILIFPLFAVGNDRRASGFEPLDGVSNRIFIERSEARIITVAFCDSLDESSWPWDAADWLGGYGEWPRFFHPQSLTVQGPDPHTALSLD